MRKLKRNKIRSAISKAEKIFTQSLFSSIDSCAERCVEIEYVLTQKEISKKAASCISLCRDFADLGPMLGIFMMRKSPVTIQIAQTLYEIITRLSGLLMQLNQPHNEMIKCAEILKISITKIDSHGGSQNIN